MLNPDNETRTVMEVIVGIASKDFSKRAPLAGDGSMLDGIAAGLNMLAEEMVLLLTVVELEAALSRLRG